MFSPYPASLPAPMNMTLSADTTRLAIIYFDYPSNAPNASVCTVPYIPDATSINDIKVFNGMSRLWLEFG